FSARGAVIGFGGRILGEGEPKYLNSPETPLFEKGREVYGLVQAREAIRASGRVIVVEGYMDVISLAQFGVAYGVAALGTATTPVHVSRLLRLADEIVFCFDGDAAGRKAARRALETSLPLASDAKTIRFLFLPDGEDPDTFVRKHGKDAFEQLIPSSQTLSGFLLGELRAAVDFGTAEGRSRFLTVAKPYLQRIAAPALKLQVLKEVAALAKVSQEEAERLLDVRGWSGARMRPGPARTSAPAATNLEWTLLRYLLLRPQRVPDVDLSLMDPALPESAVIAALVEWWGSAPPAQASGHPLLIEKFSGTPHAETLFEAQQSLLDLALSEDDADAEIANCLDALRVKRTGETLETMRGRLAGGGPSELAAYARLLKEFEELKRGRLARQTGL
ncbi:MAG: toprim domain-containing protein, partial [Terriglobales bacterium]